MALPIVGTALGAWTTELGLSVNDPVTGMPLTSAGVVAPHWSGTGAFTDNGVTYNILGFYEYSEGANRYIVCGMCRADNTPMIPSEIADDFLIIHSHPFVVGLPMSPTNSGDFGLLDGNSFSLASSPPTVETYMTAHTVPRTGVYVRWQLPISRSTSARNVGFGLTFGGDLYNIYMANTQSE